MSQGESLAPSSMAEACLERASLQSTIFAEHPSRTDLLALEWSWTCSPLAIVVHRNQPFEFVASVLRPFLAYAGRDVAVDYSEYDDTLGMDTGGAAAVEVVWIDFDRYQMPLEDLLTWFVERLSVLRGRTDAPILVMDWASPTEAVRSFNDALRVAAEGMAGVHVCDQAAVAAGLGPGYLDTRATVITGSRLSGAAAVETARALGLRWIPAALGQRIKAVVTDLDNTLYAGVLGEDGIDGIDVTADHAALQRDLLAMRNQGIFVAVATRNDRRDVDALLAPAGPLIIKAPHLSSLAVGWAGKAVAIARIAADLRVGTEDVLFIDDNPGELAQVAASGGVRCLHAGDPVLTRRALSLYPGVFRFRIDIDDRLRVDDLAAATHRAAEAEVAGDPLAYARSLQTVLTFGMSPGDRVARLHELSIKTNQFNTGLRRFSAAEVAHYLGDESHRVVSVALRDRLSDSGVIAAVFARRQDDCLHVDEIAISCRALGRRLETFLVLESIRRVLADLPASRIAFHWSPGPRNEPARHWLESTFGPVGDERLLEVDADVVAGRDDLVPGEHLWEEAAHV